LEKIESEVEHSAYDLSLVHEVVISKESRLYSIIGKDRFMVNSRHRMMVTNPGSFSVYGKSSDGVIELIERRDKKFAIGVQWHPEMMLDDEYQQKIFEAFVKACCK
jgi:putative glutamine amidotransferase